jgi:sterol desaturase/sphingolipid hydroxylase (fatty acid hydroxylase superfamily)
MESFVNQWFIAYSKIGLRYFFMAGGAFLLFYFILKTPMMRRKVQPKFPQMTDYGRDIFYSAISIAIFSAISVWTMFVIKPYTNIYDHISDYGTVYYAFTFIWMFFLHDAYFYWAHRVMHHPKIFKWVHLVHHKSNNPSPWTAYAFHPLEAVVEAAIVPIFAFTLPVHRSAIIIYMLFQIAYNVYGHLGYEIFPKNTHKHWLGKWFNTSVAHNMHHKYSVKNYGLWTTIWDRLMGTMHEKYDEMYEKTTGNSIPTEGGIKQSASSTKQVLDLVK